MSLVEKIKQLCRERKITVAELERRTGISNGQIRKWETTTPGIDKVEKVADYFGVTTDYLLGREPAKFPSKETLPTDLDEILDNMMSFDGKPMTENDREAIRAYLEGRFSSK